MLVGMGGKAGGHACCVEGLHDKSLACCLLSMLLSPNRLCSYITYMPNSHYTT